MNVTGYLPVTLEELTNAEVPRRLIGLAELVQQVCDRAITATVADGKWLGRPITGMVAGRYIRIGAAGAWVGLDHRLWARYGIGPLWIFFSASEFGRAVEVLDAIAPWLSSNPVRGFQWEGAAAIPLRITPYATRDIVLDDLHAQIVELHHLLKGISKAGDTVLPGPPRTPLSVCFLSVRSTALSSHLRLPGRAKYSQALHNFGRRVPKKRTSR